MTPSHTSTHRHVCMHVYSTTLQHYNNIHTYNSTDSGGAVCRAPTSLRSDIVVKERWLILELRQRRDGLISTYTHAAPMIPPVWELAYRRGDIQHHIMSYNDRRGSCNLHCRVRGEPQCTMPLFMHHHIAMCCLHHCYDHHALLYVSR